MPTETHVGNNGSHKAKEIWVGNNGSHKAKEVWVKTAAGIKKVFSAAFEFTFAADNKKSEQYILTGSLDGDFVLTFLSSGDLTITGLGEADAGIDIFCVAAGYDGTHAEYQSSEPYYIASGGHGGSGGACVTVTGKTIAETRYRIEVGNANGAKSSFGSLASASGPGAAGGAGGQTSSATKGADGTYAFNEKEFVTNYAAGTRFGPGGGGGHGWYNWTNFPAASGGETGGAAGGYGDTYPTGVSTAGANATTPGGGGGGGGALGGVMNAKDGNSKTQPGGAGARGIVMIRNKR